MTLDRRDLLALSLAAAAGPAVAAVTEPLPVWPPAEHFPLWPGRPPGAPATLPTPAPAITGRPGEYRDVQLRGVAMPEVGVIRPRRPDGRAVLIMPGGGYGMTSVRNEGLDVAQALATFGITGFVLSYRLPGEGWTRREDAPLADAQRAMRLIRADASRYGVDPARLGAIGFSAGGHLCGSLATQHAYAAYRPLDDADRRSARPAFAGLIYAVSNMDAGRSHGGSRRALLGPEPSREAEGRYDIERNIGRDTPPLFILHAQDDDTVPFANGMDLFAAARAAGTPTEAHFLLEGRHGFGTRLPDSNPGSLWPALFARWSGEALTRTAA